jgi:hypothetical protein
MPCWVAIIALRVERRAAEASSRGFELLLDAGQLGFTRGACGPWTLRRFDAGQPFVYGKPVTTEQKGSPFFQGKVRSLPASATGESEGQQRLVSDVWDDLEATIYHEPWSAGAAAGSGVGRSLHPGLAGRAYRPNRPNHGMIDQPMFFEEAVRFLLEMDPKPEE